jgi:hypothetical protein
LNPLARLVEKKVDIYRPVDNLWRLPFNEEFGTGALICLFARQKPLDEYPITA